MVRRMARERSFSSIVSLRKSKRQFLSSVRQDLSMRSADASFSLTAGTVANCLITGNKVKMESGGLGGGVYMSGGAIRNCTIADNSGFKGGGLYFDYIGHKAYNCLVQRNSSGGAADTSRIGVRGPDQGFGHGLLDGYQRSLANSRHFSATTDQS